MNEKMPALLPAVGVAPQRIALTRFVRGIVEPSGIVYSTSPELWADAFDTFFVVKGPDTTLVAAELVCHMLAAHVEVSVPPYAIATHPQHAAPFFASQWLESANRDAEPFLKMSKPTSLEQLAMVVLLDLWVVNDDRNIGNILAVPVEGEERPPDIVAIDFEKALVARSRFPVTESPTVPIERLQPKGPLGTYASRTRRPVELIHTIKRLPDMAIQNIVDSAQSLIGPEYSWADGTATALIQRRDRLEEMASEVWR